MSGKGPAKEHNILVPTAQYAEIVGMSKGVPVQVK